MKIRSAVIAQKIGLIFLVAVVASVGLIWLLKEDVLFAQESKGNNRAASPAHKPTDKTPEKPVQGVQNSAPPANFAEKLNQNGVVTCNNQINSLVSETMSGVSQFNTASQWSKNGADKRIVSVSVGQKYRDGNAVPFATTSVVASPNPQGTCDAFMFQIVPSPLSCAKLRDNMTANGRLIGDLAGIPMMEDARGQTMLIPTASESCVLVGIKTVYAK